MNRKLITRSLNNPPWGEFDYKSYTDKCGRQGFVKLTYKSSYTRKVVVFAIYVISFLIGYNAVNNRVNLRKCAVRIFCTGVLYKMTDGNSNSVFITNDTLSKWSHHATYLRYTDCKHYTRLVYRALGGLASGVTMFLLNPHPWILLNAY